MQRSPPRWRHWWLPLLWFVVLLGLGRWSVSTPAPAAADAPDDRFSAGRAEQVLHELLDGVGPHPTGTTAAATVRRRIARRLAALGYTPEVTRDTVCNGRTCATVHNVLALRPGADPSLPLVLVSAHYDSVPAGPGYGDNGSGVAAALEIARLLQARPTPAGVLFLFNEGEETNLLGALAFVRCDAAGRVGSVVNIDARGVRGPALLFETSGPSGPVTAAYARHARSPAVSSLYVEIYRLLPNGTDLGVFANSSIPGANFAFVEGGGLYHTALDDRAHLAPGTLQHMGEQALGATLGFADAVDLSDGEDSVVFDVLSTVVVAWPASTVWWGLVPLGLWFLAVSAGLVARGHASVGRAAAAVVLTPVVVAATVAAGLGVEWVLREAGGSWQAVAWPFRLAMWCVALCGVSLLGAELGRWLRTAAVWIGVGVTYLVLALGLAWLLPGGSYLAVVPLAAMTLGMTMTVFSREPQAPVWGASAAPIGGLLLVVLALGLETALGLSAGFVVAPAALGLLPLATLLPGAPRWRLTGALAAAVVVFAGVAAFMPPRSPEAPDGVELYHVQLGDEAWWEASNRTWPSGGDFPPSWPDFAAGGAAGTLSLGDAAAPAATWDAPDPTVEVLERSDTSVRFRLASIRGGHRVGVVLPSGTRRVAFDGERVPRKRGIVWFYGETARGVVVDLRTASALPETLTVLDMASGMPPDGLTWPDDVVPIHDGASTVRVVRVPSRPPVP